VCQGGGMKFSKVLQQTVTELPELNDMFLRYKELKKQLKSIPRKEEHKGGVWGGCAPIVHAFVHSRCAYKWPL